MFEKYENLIFIAGESFYQLKEAGTDNSSVNLRKIQLAQEGFQLANDVFQAELAQKANPEPLTVLV